jgi:hypothetical protein
MRKAGRMDQRKAAAVNVFLAMQSQPFLKRLKLARMLVFQSDLRFYAKKRGISLKSLMAERKQKRS